VLTGAFEWLSRYPSQPATHRSARGWCESGIERADTLAFVLRTGGIILRAHIQGTQTCADDGRARVSRWG
jgi:hypothetical protein